MGSLYYAQTGNPARGAGRPTALMVETEKLRGVLLDDFVGSRVVEHSDWWPTEARKVYERLRWLPLHADMIIAEDEGEGEDAGWARVRALQALAVLMAMRATLSPSTRPTR